MIELNRRERYMLLNAFIMMQLRLIDSGDYPEKKLHDKFAEKVGKWVYEAEGDITSDEGVGE